MFIISIMFIIKKTPVQSNPEADFKNEVYKKVKAYCTSLKQKCHQTTKAALTAL